LALDHSVADLHNEMVSASNPLNSAGDFGQNVRGSLSSIYADSSDKAFNASVYMCVCVCMCVLVGQQSRDSTEWISLWLSSVIRTATGTSDAFDELLVSIFSGPGIMLGRRRPMRTNRGSIRRYRRQCAATEDHFVRIGD
jgi:hypothetical protein